jgi:dihydropteroate synthase
MRRSVNDTSGLYDRDMAAVVADRAAMLGLAHSLAPPRSEPPRRRSLGSLAAAVICITKGARIVRMHDVAATVAVVRMTEAVLGLRPPAYLRHNVESA